MRFKMYLIQEFFEIRIDSKLHVSCMTVVVLESCNLANELWYPEVLRNQLIFAWSYEALFWNSSITLTSEQARKIHKEIHGRGFIEIGILLHISWVEEWWYIIISAKEWNWFPPLRLLLSLRGSIINLQPLGGVLGSHAYKVKLFHNLQKSEAFFRLKSAPDMVDESTLEDSSLFQQPPHVIECWFLK